MFTYNPKDWFKFIFFFRQSDAIRKLLPAMIILALFTWLVAWLELKYLLVSEREDIKNISVMHTMLTFVISMLLVFRTNSAYDRWWEGRKLWGSLVNNSRNLAIKLNGILLWEDKYNRNFYNKYIPLYASVLAHHLQSEVTRLALDENEHPELAEIDRNRHIPNQVAALLFQRTNRLYEEKKISGDQLIILNGELLSFTDICGACERIKNTPIPFSYSIFLKRFILIFIITLPFGFVLSLHYWAIPAVAIIFYALAGLEIIAEEIEEPFGGDANDLPIMKIAEGIKKHVAEIL
jgi:putative membrane protein